MLTSLPDTQPKIRNFKMPIEDTPSSSSPTTKEPVMQVARASDIRNPWICQHCGAIMGSVYHEKIRPGLSISVLILFRGAAMLHEMLPANYIFGKVHAGEFGCSRCGEVRSWHPTPETLRYLEENHRKPVKRNRNL
jgi:hypothetical protein